MYELSLVTSPEHPTLLLVRCLTGQRPEELQLHLGKVSALKR